MADVVDGEWQKYSVEPGSYMREHFFGADPRLAAMVADKTDDELKGLRRGGHDYRKLYAAYAKAVEPNGAPTVILAQTVKGWTLGSSVEARNITHQAKKMNDDEVRVFRDRLELPIPDEALHEVPYYHPGPDSPEIEYLQERRAALGGYSPRRVVISKPLDTPGDAVYGEFASGSGSQEVSTTMAFAKLLRNLLRDEGVGERIVPIIPDEARTFGMDSLFQEVGIYSALGQLYNPVDSNLMFSYREDKAGQILEEGLTEAGSTASMQAAGTSYATHAEPMIPFYIFYSMFGFQRTADEIWAFQDARGRGFMMGATAGRTTLNGEGLQHEDGHSLVHASHFPSCRVYDPAFAYETAAIVKDGIERMYGPDPQDVFYYVTLYNENHVMPERPAGVTDEDIISGLYRFAEAPAARARRAAGHDPGLRRDHAAGARGAGDPGRAVRRGRRGLQRALVPAPAQRGPRGRALEPAQPGPGARAARDQGARGARLRRADRGRVRLDHRLARPRQPLGPDPRPGARWAPTATVAATPARHCVGSSTSTPRISPRRCSWSWVGRGRLTASWWPRPWSSSTSSPRLPSPSSGDRTSTNGPVATTPVATATIVMT